MDFLSAPSNFLAQCFRNFDSKILGLRILSMKLGRTVIAAAAAAAIIATIITTRPVTLIIHA